MTTMLRLIPQHLLWSCYWTECCCRGNGNYTTVRTSFLLCSVHIFYFYITLGCKEQPPQLLNIYIYIYIYIFFFFFWCTFRNSCVYRIISSDVTFFFVVDVADADLVIATNIEYLHPLPLCHLPTLSICTHFPSVTYPH